MPWKKALKKVGKKVLTKAKQSVSKGNRKKTASNFAKRAAVAGGTALVGRKLVKSGEKKGQKKGFKAGRSVGRIEGIVASHKSMQRKKKKTTRKNHSNHRRY